MPENDNNIFSEDIITSSEKVKGFNLFKLIRAFSDENILSKEARKALKGFNRDEMIESIMLDGDLEYDSLSSTQKDKVNEYYLLLSKISLPTDISRDEIDRVSKRLIENENNLKKVKKRRWKDVKKTIGF